MLTNPPYGERLGDLTEAARLEKILGERFLASRPLSLSVITSDADFEKISAYGPTAGANSTTA